MSALLAVLRTAPTAPGPAMVPGCQECGRYGRILGALQGARPRDASAISDARVLWRRHVGGAHAGRRECA